MARRNRECYLCGTEYKYCPTCSEDKMKPAWMAEFHSEDCVKIFAICTDFNMGKMSKSDAQSALNKCDLSNRPNFMSCIQHDLDVIFAEEPKKKFKKTESIDIEFDTHEVVIKKENE